MSDLEIFNVEQGTPEWKACRIGIPTASEFETVLRKSGRGPGGTSKERRTYMLKLIGEALTGEPMESFSNAHMERGKAMEDEARKYYELAVDVTTQRIGFMRRGRAGASPDSLVGDDGLLEIKTKLPHLQLEVLDAGQVPAEHLPQIQGQLWISGRAWVDFVSYWPGIRPFIKRVHRDDAYIAELAAAVEAFNKDLDALMAKLDLKPLAKAA